MLLAATFAGIGAYAQNKEVTGTVLDESNLGVPGAYVLVKGSTRGVMTDNDGRFSISVKPSDVLVAQFLGYEDLEIKVGSQTDIVFNLTPQANVLDEVVMVAYGAQRKASVIGSISSVDLEQIKIPVGQLSSSLAGKLAGIVVMQHTGEPGAGADFWIRGMNTFGANAKPLVLVDGVERDMDLVDAEDIASFSILKDATATALYGVRGANGIVLITTKRGSESKPKSASRQRRAWLPLPASPSLQALRSGLTITTDCTSNAEPPPLSAIIRGNFTSAAATPTSIPPPTGFIQYSRTALPAAG